MPQISTITRFVQFTPTTANVSYYTVTAANAILKDIVISNSSASSVTIRIHIVPSGGTNSVANAIVYNLSLLPNDTQILNLSLVLNNGDTIQARASVSNVVGVTMSGVTVA